MERIFFFIHCDWAVITDAEEPKKSCESDQKGGRVEATSSQNLSASVFMM